MSGGDNERKELDRLADAMLDDILRASDDDILREAKEDGINGEAEAARLRATFNRVVLEAGKAKMAAAKQAVADYRSRSPAAQNRTAPDRDRSARLAALNPVVGSKLTLAARKGGEFSEDDVNGLLDDADELDRLTATKPKP